MILRRLHRDIVGDAVLRAEPEGRIDLLAARKRDQHVLRHGARGEIDLLQAGAVHLQPHGRLVQPLMDMDVHRARQLPDLARQLGRLRKAGFLVHAQDLHVHGGGLAEIEDLGDDVGRLEEELDAGKVFRELSAQFVDIAARRLVAFLQRDHDFAVGRTHHAGIAVGQVDARIGQAEIVEDGFELPGGNDRADEGVDLVGESRGLLDARAGWGAHVQADGSAVDRGKEILAEREDQPQRPQAEGEEADAEGAAMGQQHAEQDDIDRPQPLEPGVEGVVDAREHAVARLLRVRRAQQQQGHQLMVDLVPELRLIIGDQPPVPQLPPRTHRTASR